MSRKKTDPFYGPKRLAYFLSQMPEKGVTLEQFTAYAKFQLAARNKVLLKDPIWDTYTTEEILIEFFAHRFNMDKKLVTEFEVAMGSAVGVVDDFAAWADKMIEDAAKEREEQAAAMEERISFDPKDVLGEE